MMDAENSNTIGQDQAPMPLSQGEPQPQQTAQSPQPQPAQPLQAQSLQPQPARSLRPQQAQPQQAPQQAPQAQPQQAPQAQAQPQSQVPSTPSRIGYTSAGTSQPHQPAPSSRTTADALVKSYLTPANLVLVGLFAFGLVALYVMGMTGRPQEASADQQVKDATDEAVLAQFQKVQNSNSWDNEISAVIDTIYLEATQRQIPLEMLNGNPFVYIPSGSAGSRMQGRNFSGGLDGVPTDLSTAMAMARSLRLQSVLAGSSGQNRALINGKMVAEGQIIRGWTVLSIEGRTVILQWRDQTFELPMPMNN